MCLPLLFDEKKGGWQNLGQLPFFLLHSVNKGLKKNMITAGSLFSGICSEFFALGALGPVRQVFAADMDPFACRFIQQNVRPDILVQDDLTTVDVAALAALPTVDVAALPTVDVAALPTVDVFLAGVPCQAFSTLGKTFGKRASTGRDLFRIPLVYADAKRPTWFVLENVPSFRSGPEFQALVEALRRIYPYVQSAVLDATAFGSIQRRKRLFVVASTRAFALPAGTVHPPPPLSSVLDPPGEGLPFVSEKGLAYLQRRQKWGVKVYDRGATAFVGTLPRAYGHQITWKHIVRESDGRLRSLTPEEGFRIQSFDPDSLDLTGLSRRQRFYLAGNAIDRRLLTGIFSALPL